MASRALSSSWVLLIPPRWISPMWTVSRHRSVQFAFLVLCVASSALPAASQETASLAAVTVRTPDAFYDPPTERPVTPGELLRSEPLKNVTLPHGLRGW